MVGRTLAEPQGRPNKFTDVGVVGRKTGLMVKDTGRRDSNGLEDMDAFFSPADKSTKNLGLSPSGKLLLSRTKFTATLKSDSTISMSGTSSSAREPAEVLASRRATLLAPGRTPTKTYLKSPAGRVQTPKLNKLDSPLRVPLVREFSFAGFEPDEEDEELAPANVDLDVIRSPTERLVPHSSKARGLTQRSRTTTYEEQEDEEEEEEAEQVEQEEQPEDSEMGFNGGNDYDYGGYGGGDGFGDDDYDQGEPMEDEVEEQEVEEQYVDEPLQQEEEEEDIYGEQFSPAPQPAHSKPAPAKQSSKPKQATKPRKRQPKQTSSKPSTSTLPPKSPRVIPKIVERRIVPTVEEEDANGEVRRSKRIRVAPLAHWKGERIVYELEGRRASGPALPRIKEIVKIDTPPEPSRRQPTTTTNRKRKSRQDSDSEDDDSDAGEVFTTIKSYEEDGLINDYRIAVSRSAINPRPLQGSKIRFEKLFQDGEYMATGVLDIGVGGEKGIKSTKHAFLSFVVMTGKAEVKVHRTAFVIGKGGVFVVPRGNHYSIKNVGNKVCRMFFSQAVEQGVQIVSGEEQRDDDE